MQTEAKWESGFGGVSIGMTVGIMVSVRAGAGGPQGHKCCRDQEPPKSQPELGALLGSGLWECRFGDQVSVQLPSILLELRSVILVQMGKTEAVGGGPASAWPVR